jgi:GTP:adenosylcobinamide-phosphate guanylyltransferase
MSGPVVRAVVLAGGRAKADLAAATGVTNRALVPVNGLPMVQHVCGALQAAASVGEIVVVGDLPAPAGCDAVRDHGGFVENLCAGLEQTGGGTVLVSTCDIPFVTADALDDLVTRGTDLRADIVYPIVQVDLCYVRFPGVKRTSLRLREGRFTGGNAMLVNGAFLMEHRERVAEAYAARKAPARLAMMLGMGTVVRLFGALTFFPNALRLAGLEAAVSGMLGGTARALIMDYPEIATDIDRLSDLQAIGASEPQT